MLPLAENWPLFCLKLFITFVCLIFIRGELPNKHEGCISLKGQGWESLWEQEGLTCCRKTAT